MKNMHFTLLSFLLMTAVSVPLFGMEKLVIRGVIDSKPGIFYASQPCHKAMFGEGATDTTIPIVPANISIYQNQEGSSEVHCFSNSYDGVYKDVLKGKNLDTVLLSSLLKKNDQGKLSFCQVGDVIRQEHANFILELRVVDSSSLSESVQKFKENPQLVNGSTMKSLTGTSDAYYKVAGELVNAKVITEKGVKNGQMLYGHGEESYLKKCGLLEVIDKTEKSIAYRVRLPEDLKFSFENGVYICELILIDSTNHKEMPQKVEIDQFLGSLKKFDENFMDGYVNSMLIYATENIQKTLREALDKEKEKQKKIEELEESMRLVARSNESIKKLDEQIEKYEKENESVKREDDEAIGRMSIVHVWKRPTDGVLLAKVTLRKVTLRHGELGDERSIFVSGLQDAISRGETSFCVEDKKYIIDDALKTLLAKELKALEERAKKMSALEAQDAKDRMWQDDGVWRAAITLSKDDGLSVSLMPTILEIQCALINEYIYNADKTEKYDVDATAEKTFQEVICGLKEKLESDMTKDISGAEFLGEVQAHTGAHSNNIISLLGGFPVRVSSNVYGPAGTGILTVTLNCFRDNRHSTVQYLVGDPRLNIILDNKMITSGDGTIYVVQEKIKEQFDKELAQCAQENKFDIVIKKDAEKKLDNKIEKFEKNNEPVNNEPVKKEDDEAIGTMSIKLVKHLKSDGPLCAEISFTHKARCFKGFPPVTTLQEAINGNSGKFEFGGMKFVVDEDFKSSLTECINKWKAVEEKCRQKDLGEKKTAGSSRYVLPAAGLMIVGVAGIVYLMYIRSPQFRQGFGKYVLPFLYGMPGFRSVIGMFS